MLSSHSTIHFVNESDGRELELDIKGDWFDRSAKITFDGRPVAHITRSFFNVREMFGDKQTVSFFSLSSLIVPFPSRCFLLLVEVQNIFSEIRWLCWRFKVKRKTNQPIIRLDLLWLDHRTIADSIQTQYFVTVAPGVDLALIAAICISLDEKENEK